MGRIKNTTFSPYQRPKLQQTVKHSSFLIYFPFIPLLQRTTENQTLTSTPSLQIQFVSFRGIRPVSWQSIKPSTSAEIQTCISSTCYFPVTNLILLFVVSKLLILLIRGDHEILLKRINELKIDALIMIIVLLRCNKRIMIKYVIVILFISVNRLKFILCREWYCTWKNLWGDDLWFFFFYIFNEYL